MGALVTEVKSGSTGEQGGSERGRCGGRHQRSAIDDANGLTIQVIQMAPGSVAHLDVIRNGKTMKIDVTLGTRPTEDKEGRDFTSQNSWRRCRQRSGGSKR